VCSSDLPMTSRLLSGPIRSSSRPSSTAADDAALPRFTIFARALGLLAGQGASFGLLAWECHAWTTLEAYTATNVLAPRCRGHAVLAMAAGIGLATLLGVILTLVRRGRGIDLVSRVARRSAPLCLVAFVPLLFRWQLWVGKDLLFLALASIFALSLQALLRVALAAPPVVEIDWPRVRLLERRPFAVLRWAGLPFAITCVVATFCAAYFAYYAVVAHYDVHTSALDLGIETNLVWRAAHGSPFFGLKPLTPETVPGAVHQTFFAYVIASVFRIVPRPETLLVLQSMLTGAAAIALFLVARPRVGPWTACLFACLLVLYPPFHGSVLYDFHYQPLSTFFVLMSLHLLESRRTAWAAVLVVLTMSLHEDMGLLVATIGGYLVVTGKRPRAGLIVAFGGAACFLALNMIVMPRAAGGVASLVSRYAQLGPEKEPSLVGAVTTLLGNPPFVLHSLLAQSKVEYVLALFAPLAFLSWRRPAGLLLFVPGLLLTLLPANAPSLTQISLQHTAYWTPFVFLAAVDAIAWMQRADTHPAVARVRSGAWLFAAVGSMLVCSHQLGAILQQNTAKAASEAFAFGRNAKDDLRHADLYELIRKIAPTASVLATEHVMPHVSSRAEAFELRGAKRDADYVVVGFPLREDEKAPIAEMLRSGKFGVVDVRGDFALAKRGQPTDRNAPLLARVGG
jgi:uncharacterized membrane protein